MTSVAWKTVILVDDGLATGASMLVAVRAVRALNPQSIVVGVPVASRAGLAMVREAADECVCVAVPEPFMAAGAWYDDFSQTADEDVRRLLAENARAFDTRHVTPVTGGW